jgi:Tol biopolymer transport system component
MKRSQKLILMASGILLLAILSAAGLLLHFFLTAGGTPGGKILLIYHRAGTVYDSELLMMDGNGNNIRWIGGFSGSPAWSPDGQLVAVGCSENNQTPDLCILDIRTLHDATSFPSGYANVSPSIIRKIGLPALCKNIKRQDIFPQPGILSTSWSGDGKKIAVVCGDEHPEAPKIVCVIPFNGDSICWDKSISGEIYRAVWSPIEDRLAISGPADPASKIFLVGPDGTNPTFLANGWSPAWSPDGKQIAFIHFNPVDDPQHGETGIALINKNGTDQHWIYYPDPKANGDDVIYFDCMGISGTCRLTWSPDGRYIAFVSSDTQLYSYHLYSLDIKTGKITILLDRMVFYWFIAEPDWGP